MSETNIASDVASEQDCNAERRNAEMEFVSAAYSPEEAWSTRGTTVSEIDDSTKDNGNSGTSTVSICSVHRRLLLSVSTLGSISSIHNEDDDDGSDSLAVPVCLTLTMPHDYPAESPLQIDVTTTNESFLSDSNSSISNSTLQKAVWNALPHLAAACREQAEAMVGSEAILTVLTFAEQWIEDEWPKYIMGTRTTTKPSSSVVPSERTSTKLMLGRRLIYAHHLISKTKRNDIRNLCKHYALTGYVKIGWPGLLLIEGVDERCNQFYQDVKRWSWKYLVVRGEQQEVVIVPAPQEQSETISKWRKFPLLVETSEMSIVGQHCRQVGLEALFRTSMKVYDNENEQHLQMTASAESPPSVCGTLVLVDHMNNAKMYRKWLRKTSRQLDCLLFIQQCHRDEYSTTTKKPMIVVGIVGTSVSEFMKRWRTSRVDVDSKGRSCLERQMTVIADGPMESKRVDCLDWGKLQDDNHVNVSLERLDDLIDCLGGTEWSNAFKNHCSSC